MSAIKKSFVLTMESMNLGNRCIYPRKSCPHLKLAALPTWELENGGEKRNPLKSTQTPAPQQAKFSDSNQEHIFSVLKNYVPNHPTSKFFSIVFSGCTCSVGT